MKQVVIFVFLFTVISCDKLDNTYLPPKNAQSSAGANFVHPPTTVEDLRSISGQYLSPGVQNSRLNQQYLPPNVGRFDRGDQKGSGGVFPQPYAPTNEYSSPNSQYSSSNGQYSSPSVQKSRLNQQYLQPNVGSFDKGDQKGSKGVFLQPYAPTNEYSSPNSQYSSSNGQYSSPSVQKSRLNQQYLPPNVGSFEKGDQKGSKGVFPQPYAPTNKFSSPNSQYSSSNGQYSSPSVQKSRLNQQYLPPNVGSFDKGDQKGSKGFFPQPYAPINEYSSPNSQYSSSNGQYSSPRAVNPQGSFQSTHFAPPQTSFNTKAPSFKQEPAPQYQTAILRSSSSPNAGDGTYQYSYETENGISAAEEGSSVNNAETARGSYSYTSPEGESIVVEYVADENGFQPKGSYIPEIPEAIQKSIELNKAAAGARSSQASGAQYQEVNVAPKAIDRQYGTSQIDRGSAGGPSGHFDGSLVGSFGAFPQFGAQNHQEGYKY